MRMKKNLIAMLCALCCTLGAFGLSACKTDSGEPTEQKITRNGLEYEWSEQDRGYYVSAADPSITTARIPAAVDGFRVIGVSPSAFYGYESLTSVSVAKGVNKIGSGAFCNCFALAEISLPKGITEIGYSAFADTAFWNAHENWDGEVLYIGSYLIAVGALKGEYTVKDGTELIAEEAFLYCGADPIGCPDIAPSDKTTREEASPASGSSSNDSFSGITVPEGVKHIGNRAFYGCEHLDRISLPESLQTVGAAAFQYTAYAKNAENWEDGALYLGPCLLETRGIAREYTVKDGTKFIDREVFYRGDVNAVHFPKSLKAIGDHAFYGCSHLEQIHLPEGLETVGEQAFYGCNSVYSVTIPKSIRSIGKSAFRFTNTDTDVYLSDLRIWCLSSYAFETATDNLNLYLNGKPLTDLVIPKGVTTVRNFKNCDSIVSVRFSNDVVRIEDKAFLNCGKLKKVELPKSLKSIGTGAFENCPMLKSVKIPSGVTQIGARAFENCTALKSVFLPSSLTELSECLFLGCTALTSVKVPEGVTSIGRAAFRGCTALKSVSLPHSLKSVNGAAFCDCTSLTDLSYKGTAEEWHDVFCGYRWNYGAECDLVSCRDGDITV